LLLIILHILGSDRAGINKGPVSFSHYLYGGMMILSADKLRQNLYRILDEILDSGIPVKISRKGEILKIIPEKKESKLERLKEHKTIIGDPESIIDIDFSDKWKEKDNI